MIFSFGIMSKALFIATVVLLGLSSTYYFKMKNDNIVEEIAEKVLKTQTGIDVDLSPATPEFPN